MVQLSLSYFSLLLTKSMLKWNIMFSSHQFYCVMIAPKLIYYLFTSTKPYSQETNPNNPNLWKRFSFLLIIKCCFYIYVLNTLKCYELFYIASVLWVPPCPRVKKLFMYACPFWSQHIYLSKPTLLSPPPKRHRTKRLFIHACSIWNWCIYHLSPHFVDFNFSTCSSI